MNFSSAAAAAAANIPSPASALVLEQIFSGFMFPPPPPPPSGGNLSKGLVIDGKAAPAGLPPWIPPASLGENVITSGSGR